MCCNSGTFLVEYTERYVVCVCVCGITEPDPKRMQYGVTSLRRDVLLQFVRPGGANHLRRLANGCSKQSASTGCSARPSAVH